MLDEAEEGVPTRRRRRRPAVAAPATVGGGRRRATPAVAGRRVRTQGVPPGGVGWRLRRAGACRAARCGVASATGPRAAGASCGVGGSDAAWNAAASSRELHARGERGLHVPYSVGQLPNCDEPGGEGSRQDEALRRDQSRWRVLSGGSGDWRSGGRAGAVSTVTQPDAGGDGSSDRLSKPGGGLGSGSRDDRPIMAGFAPATNRTSGLVSLMTARAEAEANFHPRSRAGNCREADAASRSR